MDKLDYPSDSTESSSSWEFVAETEDQIKQFQEEFSGNESDGASVVSDCEEAHNFGQENSVNKEDEPFPKLEDSYVENIGSFDNRQIVENIKHSVVSNDNKKQQNGMFCLSSVAMIVLLSICLYPLSDYFCQLFENKGLENFGNDGCPEISKYYLEKQVSEEKNEILFNKVQNGDNENSDFQKLREKNKKNAKVKQEKRSKEKNNLEFEKADVNERELSNLLKKLKKKKEKLQARAELIKKKEKYLEAKEKKLLILEKELNQKSEMLKKLLRKEKKRVKNWPKFSVNDTKKMGKVNKTVPGDWYRDMYLAREKIRKQEHASDWLFELYKYRETKRKDKKKKYTWTNIYSTSQMKR